MNVIVSEVKVFWVSRFESGFLAMTSMCTGERYIPSWEDVVSYNTRITVIPRKKNSYPVVLTKTDSVQCHTCAHFLPPQQCSQSLFN